MAGIKARGLPPPVVSPGADLFDGEEEAAVLRVLRGRRTSRYYPHDDASPSKSEIEAFEAELRDFLDAHHVVTVSSGTAALLSGMAALGIGPQHEVVVPCYGFVAIPAVVAAVGARAVAVGIDDSLSIDPRAVARALSPRTAAVVVAHMRGAPADMHALADVANPCGVPLVEDTSQALGGRYRGRRLGTLGALGTYSFQSRKVVTTGEGGAVVSGDARLAERVFTFQDCSENWRRFASGQDRTWPFAMAGVNLRYSEILAALGRVQLRKLPQVLVRMRENHEAIAGALADQGVALRPTHDPDGATGTHLIFRVGSARAAREVAMALNLSGLRSQPLHEPTGADMHCLAGWARYHDHMTIGPGVRGSMDLLRRHVQIEVDHRWSPAQCDQVADAVLRAIENLPARHSKEGRC